MFALFPYFSFEFSRKHFFTPNSNKKKKKKLINKQTKNDDFSSEIIEIHPRTKLIFIPELHYPFHWNGIEWKEELSLKRKRLSPHYSINWFFYLLLCFSMIIVIHCPQLSWIYYIVALCPGYFLVIVLTLYPHFLIKEKGTPSLSCCVEIMEIINKKSKEETG